MTFIMIDNTVPEPCLLTDTAAQIDSCGASEHWSFNLSFISSKRNMKSTGRVRHRQREMEDRKSRADTLRKMSEAESP